MSEMSHRDRLQDEKRIRRILNDAFSWALTKDRGLFESIFANDSDFFTYFPSASTVVGWEQFSKVLDGWMDPRNKALSFDIRDLRVVLSRSGDVAWFSAVVDDEGEFDEQTMGC